MAKRSSKGSSSTSGLLLGALLGGGLVAGAGYLYLHPAALRGIRGSAGIHGDYPGAENGAAENPGAEEASAAKRPPLSKPQDKPHQQPVTPAPSEVAPPNPAEVAAGQPPFAASEDVFEAAAPIYRKQCAACHGTPSGKPRTGGAPQFWVAGASSVGHKAPSAIYTVIAKGSPKVSGHAFAGKLSSQQIWQLTLLLKEAGNDLPDPVRNLLGD
ncbi:c-type cytochrome [Terriglobus albidus]|uniref:c-type cytochrome n=1 Tax=Terriglobus albidus TaxID=1592106 RepID=UPI0021E0182E|nr:c-type cytochrome [Terriglobus albidus]